MVDTAAQANDAAHDNPSHDQGHQQDHNQNNGSDHHTADAPAAVQNGDKQGNAHGPDNATAARSLSSIPT